MDAPAPSSLAPDALANRLHELAGDERRVQVDFLLHLDEFDRRRAYLVAGYESLWAYCLQVLHLREGPAGRRIGAMRVLRRFQALEAPLRDGRLCLSIVTLLGPLLRPENLDDLVARAAYRTKADVEHLVVSLQPRVAPREGLRKLPARQGPSDLLAGVDGDAAAAISTANATSSNVTLCALAPLPSPLPASRGEGDDTEESTPRHLVELRPVSADRWSLRVTLGTEMKDDLETLASLLSHAKGADLASVLHEAIRCGIDKHGKRRGAVAPTRARPSPVRSADNLTSPGTRTTIPAQVRREVWLRDGGRCTWTGPDGHACGSRFKLEFDHVVPVARGGASTIDNVRLLCRRHNLLHAEQTFGREHMARFAGAQLILG